MNLQSLVGKNLDRVKPDAEAIRRLFAGAARRFADAQITDTSTEARFVSAYTSARMIADAGLHASGFRIRTSVPGHHRIAIQALVTTLGIDEKVVARLDQLRTLRNAAEYSGDIVPESAVAECIKQAEVLREAAREWLQKHAPELIEDGS